jgi:hypothetical protein
MMEYLIIKPSFGFKTIQNIRLGDRRQLAVANQAPDKGVN